MLAKLQKTKLHQKAGQKLSVRDRTALYSPKNSNENQYITSFRNTFVKLNSQNQTKETFMGLGAEIMKSPTIKDYKK